MKKLSYLLLIMVVAIFASCSSCRRDNGQANVDPLDVPTEFEKQLKESDTIEVKAVIDRFVNYIQNEKYYDAARMVYRLEYKGKQALPRELNNEEIERMVRVFKLFPIEDYNIEYMRFREAELNEVCISTIMQKGENGSPDAKSKMFFNPINMGGKWGLVLDNTFYGTDTFVPQAKRDSMRKVYKSSKSHVDDVVKPHTTAEDAQHVE